MVPNRCWKHSGVESTVKLAVCRVTKSSECLRKPHVPWLKVWESDSGRFYYL